MSERFLIKQIVDTDYKKELEFIGYDSSYTHKAVEKLMFKNLKIYSLSTAQANILKQLALSVGADCATNKNVITGEQKISDVILSGSYSQLRKISDKLKHQPFNLSLLANNIEDFLVQKPKRTKIVGILNITSNSFSDGGLYNTYENACKKFTELVNDGADIIDIGAESTKPNATGISSEEQIKKLIPILEYAKKQGYNLPISVDTRSSIVAEAALENGAKIINDTSGLKYDPRIADIIAKYNATIIIQHSLGNEVNMSDINSYNNVVEDIFFDLSRQVKFAELKGINSIIIDPGIGFDKNKDNNFEIIKRANEFHSLNYPVMIGISRKSFLGLTNEPNEIKDIYTLAINSILIQHGIDYIRVHNVKQHKKLLDIYGNFD